MGTSAGSRSAARRTRAVATGLLVAALVGCGSSEPASNGPRPASVAGHYAELWGHGPRTVLLLPKGGWNADGPGAVRALRPVARRFVALGWRAMTTSYANGTAGLQTVRAAWRIAHASCVYGESSGAHWALLLAARDPDVRCVIAAAAPTDLVTWPRELLPAMRPEALRLRGASFGRSGAALRRWSPARQW